MNHPIVIIGAGLSGLHAASLLTARGIECKLLEAKCRIGGRVLSTRDSNRADLGVFDLGSTWFWPEYEKSIAKLTETLHLETIPQYIKGAMLAERVQNNPPERHVLNQNPYAGAFRFAGGIQSLTEALVKSIPSGVIELETKVETIQLDDNDSITVKATYAGSEEKELHASHVILALPPRIVAKHINFSPSLPSHLTTNLISKPTWMAGQAKVIAIYERPFWRDLDLSGFANSWVGPLQEIHDASPKTGSGALFGFYGIPAKARQELGKDRVIEMAMAQLVRLFGPDAHNVSAILYKDWASEPETGVEEDLEPLRFFPSYGRPPQADVWENKIIFAGSESNSQFGGHLEGAVQSAEQAVQKIIN